MRLSTRSRYGMRAMLALALEYGRGPVMAKEIAEKQSVPPNYLEQLLVQLCKAKLLSSTRGAHGGYVLSRPPEDITLAEVLGVLEGPLDLAECKRGVVCAKEADSCALRELWEEATDALSGVFDVTLASLADAQRKKAHALDYII